MDKISLNIKDSTTLSSGVKVVNFISSGPPKYQFCFGYIFGTIFIGEIHHAEIMNWLVEEQGHSWEEMMMADQRWGWMMHAYNAEGWELRFATDDATQTPGMGEEVRVAFEEYLGDPVRFEGGEEQGYTSQDNYGQRARVQYGDEEENDAYCEWCDEYYNSEYESHDHSEKCYNCGEWYEPDEREDHDEYEGYHCEVCGDSYSQCIAYKHEEGHPECEYCEQHYDEDDAETFSEHNLEDGWEYCYDDREHYTPAEADYHRYHTTTQTGEAYTELPVEQQEDWRQNYLHAAEQLYSQFVSYTPPDYGPGLYPVLPNKTPREKTIDALVQQYNMYPTDAEKIVDLVEDRQGSQLKLFGRWNEKSAILHRGIADASDRYVFAKLAAEYLEKLAEPISLNEDGYQTSTSGKGTGGATTYNPLGEDLTLLDIEMNPQSTEYRWSYDGYDLHMWQVTNRKMYGPSHYDMFGSEGYDEHSQGRVYVSPQGEVGSLYWQISHPETEDVINQWIQANFGKPADTVYRAYGPYKGFVTPRSYFPLVDVYNLPIPPKQRWWSEPENRPDAWYYDMGMSPPGKKKRKQIVEQVPKQKPLPQLRDEPDEWKNLNKRDRRRLRRKKRNDKNKGQGKPNRGWGGKRGNIQMYEYVSGPIERQHFLVLGNGNVRVGETLTASGFRVREAMKMGNTILQPNDIFFYADPSAQDIKAVKNYFGNTGRVRWGSICFDAE